MAQIAIAGTGIVGGAVKNWFDINNTPVILYDLSKYKDNLSVINRIATILFICVPTPYGENGYDDTAIWDVLEKVSEAKQLETIVIKSTVVPLTTQFLQERYGQFKFIFNPEFLTEKNAKKDYLRSNRQIYGYTEQSKEVLDEVSKLLPHPEHILYMTSTEAELVKYAANSFLAMKVVWANCINDLASRTSSDYKKIMNGVVKDRRIGSSHTKIAPDGNRGYGGMCFPKDVKALRDYSNSVGVKTAYELFSTIDSVNEMLRK